MIVEREWWAFKRTVPPEGHVWAISWDLSLSFSLLSDITLNHLPAATHGKGHQHRFMDLRSLPTKAHVIKRAIEAAGTACIGESRIRIEMRYNCQPEQLVNSVKYKSGMDGL